MAIIANIALNNSAAASKTFVPTIKDGLLAVFHNREGDRPAVYPYLSMGMRTPKAGVSRKATLRVVLPYDVTDGDTTRVEQVTCFIDVIVPESASTTAIEDVLSFASGLLANAIVEDVCVNGAFPY